MVHGDKLFYCLITVTLAPCNLYLSEPWSAHQGTMNVSAGFCDVYKKVMFSLFARDYIILSGGKTRSWSWKWACPERKMTGVICGSTVGGLLTGNRKAKANSRRVANCHSSTVGLKHLPFSALICSKPLFSNSFFQFNVLVFKLDLLFQSKALWQCAAFLQREHQTTTQQALWIYESFNFWAALNKRC